MIDTGPYFNATDLAEGDTGGDERVISGKSRIKIRGFYRNSEDVRGLFMNFQVFLRVLSADRSL